jgi:hypothetical protein
VASVLGLAQAAPALAQTGSATQAHVAESVVTTQL